MRGKALLVALAVALGTIATAAPAQALPTFVGCGTVLYRDAFLAHDLTCPAGTGLTIAGNVTLDLRGHTLKGSTSSTGIFVDANADARVTNGSVVGWGTGLLNAAKPGFDYYEDPWPQGRLRIYGVAFSHNGAGMAVNGTDIGGFGTVAIDKTSFSTNGFGLYAQNWSGVTVTTSKFTGNTDQAIHDDTAGVSVSGSTFTKNAQVLDCIEILCTITSSSLVDNPQGITAGGAQGFVVLTSSTISGSTRAIGGGLLAPHRLEQQIQREPGGPRRHLGRRDSHREHLHRERHRRHQRGPARQSSRADR